MKEILLTSSILILVLGLLRYLLRGRINLHLQYALWLLVAVRLLVPLSLRLRHGACSTLCPREPTRQPPFTSPLRGSPPRRLLRPPAGLLMTRQSPFTMTTQVPVTFIPWEKRRLRKPTIPRFHQSRSMTCTPYYGPYGWAAQR